MAKKFNLDISKISNKKVSTLTEVKSIYNINYDELEISGKDKEQLIKYENDITFHKEKTMEHIFKYSKAIYEANKIFAKKGNGTFGKWIYQLGIDRDSANVAIRKYSLYLEYEAKGVTESQKVLSLPNRAIKTLTGLKKKEFEDEEVIEVITADNPGIKLKEIQEQKELKKLSDMEEKRTFLIKEKTRKRHLVKKLLEEIREIEKQIEAINK